MVPKMCKGWALRLEHLGKCQMGSYCNWGQVSEKNWVFGTNICYPFLIVNIWHFKLRLFDQTEPIIWNIRVLQHWHAKMKKIRVCYKDSIPLSFDINPKPKNLPFLLKHWIWGLLDFYSQPGQILYPSVLQHI